MLLNLPAGFIAQITPCPCAPCCQGRAGVVFDDWVVRCVCGDPATFRLGHAHVEHVYGAIYRCTPGTEKYLRENLTKPFNVYKLAKPGINSFGDLYATPNTLSF